MPLDCNDGVALRVAPVKGPDPKLRNEFCPQVSPSQVRDACGPHDGNEHIPRAGVTTRRACFHPDQTRRTITQKSLSTSPRLGRGCRCFSMTRFSRRRLCRPRRGGPAFRTQNPKEHLILAQFRDSPGSGLIRPILFSFLCDYWQNASFNAELFKLANPKTIELGPGIRAARPNAYDEPLSARQTGLLAGSGV